MCNDNRKYNHTAFYMFVCVNILYLAMNMSIIWCEVVVGGCWLFASERRGYTLIISNNVIIEAKTVLIMMSQ